MVKLNEMLVIQDELNRNQNKFWRYELSTKALNNAVIVECGELCEHLNYKWWGDCNKEVNLEQVHLELVDIGHFLFSQLLTSGFNIYSITGCFRRTLSNRYYSLRDLLNAVPEFLKEFIGSSSGENLNYLVLYCNLLNYAGLSFNKFYKLYVGKSTLNLFRWSHGYQDGTYIKIWDGLEDNEHLTKILKGMSDEELNSETVMQRLEETYNILTQSQLCANCKLTNLR